MQPVDEKIAGFIYPDWPAPDNVKAVMTTRQGGLSQSPFDTMNLGTHVDDAPEDVLRNRAILEQQLELPSAPLWLNQVHGTQIAEHAHNQPGDTADAVLSKQAGQVCTIMTADCLPVLFCNQQGSVIAGAHAGWRGLHSGILEKCVKKMGCQPDDILIWLGAAIGPEVFEVGEEVKDAFVSVHQDSETAFIARGDHQAGKWLADIYQLARVHLTKVGIRNENIFGGDYCTFTEASLFYSYRREARTGRMASLIWLDS